MSAVSKDGMVRARPAGRSYFPALDGIRALAFLMVFGQHYVQLLWGWTGVDVFFVLSGFLITGILYDTQDHPHRVRNFYVRRTMRIFPLYYGLMLLLVVSYPYFHWQWTWAWLLWPAYLGNFCSGIHPFAYRTPLQMLAYFQPLSWRFGGFQLYFGHFWSLCVEEQFYLIWPWVVFKVRDRKKLIYICVACAVICPLMRVVGSHTLPTYMLQQEVLNRWTPFRVDALLLGGLIALLRRGPDARTLLTLAHTGFGVLCSVLLAYLTYGFFHRNVGYAHPSWSSTWGLTFVDLLSACLIVMALEPGSATFHIFNVRPLRWMGRISYGAYVFHDIYHSAIVRVVARFTSHVQYGTAIVGLILTLLVSSASFRYFETPFIRLKDRWTRTTTTLATGNTASREGR